jgi:inosose dehydratase
VGSWIETESEIRTVLDAVDPAALSFGPDPGHLFWANADPVSLITDYRDRVRAAHLKDVHAAAREKSRFEVSDYRQATGKNHVWTELGRGDVDLVGVLKALPDAFEGWLVVEVDVPDLGTPAESTHASARWIRTQPVLQGGLV